MLKDPKYSEDFEDFPGEYDAAKWFHEHHVFAVRAADRALSRWNPPSDVRSGLEGERNWHAEMAQYDLSSLRGELPDARSNTSPKKESQTTPSELSGLAGAVVGIRTLRYDSAREACQRFLEEGRYQAVIDEATDMIDYVEEFIRDNKTDLLSLPSYGMGKLQYTLSTFYGLRASAYFAQSSGSTQEKRLLKLALQDIEQGLSYPAAAYENSGNDHRPLYRDFRDEIKQAMKPCFIATAAYGSALAPDVAMLRYFRDERLKPHPVGRWLVKIYERYAPLYARLIARRQLLRACVRRLIVAPLVSLVRRWYELEE